MLEKMPLQYAGMVLASLYNTKHNDGKYIVFDTSLFSDNLGDEIINYYCQKVFFELGLNITKRLPTHRELTKEEYLSLDKNAVKIITGTNILSSYMEKIGLWKRPVFVNRIHHLCLMGCGWSEYQNEVNMFSRHFYSQLLDEELLHSVRDKYSESKLRNAGIKNVLYTACPTMWALDEIHCNCIPEKKSNSVVATITDYSKDILDWRMLDILIQEYKNVYLWLQGAGDKEYIEEYEHHDELHLIGDRFEDYDSLLRECDVDYVGTRLHAGIHAINHLKRSIIIAVDHRAIEMARDTNLFIIKRENIDKELVNAIRTPFKTRIFLPTENINMWKNQFR